MDWHSLPISEFLSDLPKGMAFFIALILTVMGYRKGLSAEPKTEPAKKEIEIAGALVDNSAIFKLASAIEAQNALLAKSFDNQRTFIESARIVVDAFNRHAEEVRRLTDEIRDGVTAFLRHR